MVRPFQEKAAVYFDTGIQNLRPLSFADLHPLLDDATRPGVSSSGERATWRGPV
jgi:hypothetical protein